MNRMSPPNCMVINCVINCVKLYTCCYNVSWSQFAHLSQKLAFRLICCLGLLSRAEVHCRTLTSCHFSKHSVNSVAQFGQSGTSFQCSGRLLRWHNRELQVRNQAYSLTMGNCFYNHRGQSSENKFQ